MKIRIYFCTDPNSGTRHFQEPRIPLLQITPSPLRRRPKNLFSAVDDTRVGFVGCVKPEPGKDSYDRDTNSAKRRGVLFRSLSFGRVARQGPLHQPVLR
ncbi:hypothetical protein SBV1_10048 [Verrucomicrobia bacterium]|nr:hypothetical protein SBV1_10048 [Verrucomicrobiota bacterium]